MAESCNPVVNFNKEAIASYRWVERMGSGHIIQAWWRHGKRHWNDSERLRWSTYLARRQQLRYLAPVLNDAPLWEKCFQQPVSNKATWCDILKTRLICRVRCPSPQKSLLSSLSSHLHGHKVSISFKNLTHWSLRWLWAVFNNTIFEMKINIHWV